MLEDAVCRCGTTVFLDGSTQRGWASAADGKTQQWNGGVQDSSGRQLAS